MLSTQLYSSCGKAGLLVASPANSLVSGSIPAGVARAAPRWAGGRKMRRRCATRAEAAQQVNVVNTTSSSTDSAASVKAVVTVQLTMGGLLTNVGLSRGLDDISDLLGKTLLLELVASQLNPKPGKASGRHTSYTRDHRNQNRSNEMTCPWYVVSVF
ncbi:hypothetical protein V2J09_000994 [Rumex salicifolius]